MARRFANVHLDAARDLAVLGYPVLPCRPRSKVPATAHGFKDATRNERAILHMFAGRDNYNVAIACGSALAVVDVDVKAGADPKEVLDRHALTGAPMVAETAPDDEGERGLHIYCAGPARTGPTAEPGVEIRGRGSYVVCPPSIHPTGIAYRWRSGPVALNRASAIAGSVREPSAGLASASASKVFPVPGVGASIKCRGLRPSSDGRQPQTSSSPVSP